MTARHWMDDELAIFRDQVRRLLAAEFVPHATRWERDRKVDREAWRRAGDAGLLCVAIPESYGGVGGTLAHEVVLIEECHRAGIGSGFGIGRGLHSAIVAHYILAYGTEAQKQRWLPAMARGELMAAIAMTEPGAGSDLRSIRSSAHVTTDGFRLSGQKTFITNGQTADLILVAAETRQGGTSQGISLFAVEAEFAGFQRGRHLEKLGMHAQDTSELFFDDVPIPTENLLGGEPGQGFRQLTHQLAWERLICAISAVADMEVAVEETAEYVRTRTAFGRQLADFQNTRFKLAEAATLATVARSFIDDLIVRLLAGELDASTAAMAKWWTTDTLSCVADECLQLHGGSGFMAESRVGRIWVDARATRIYAGANEIMKGIVAKTILG